MQILQPELTGNLANERCLLADRVNARDLKFRHQGCDHDAGQAGATADIEHTCWASPKPTAQRRDDDKAVQQMLHQHFGGLTNGGQVVDPVPLGEQRQVGEQLRCLRVG